MESRLPSEKEADLLKIIDSNQKLLDEKIYRNERERIEILSSLNDVKMKREAIKAIHSIKEQLAQYNTYSETLNRSLKTSYEEQQSLQRIILESQNNINTLFISRRNASDERQAYLKQYEAYLSQLDRINSRLDAMAEVRKKQRQRKSLRKDRNSVLKN
jgi:chromosome segregation ATPase